MKTPYPFKIFVYFLTSVSLIFNSCQNEKAEFKRFHTYMKTATNADSVHLNKIDDTAILTLQYSFIPQLSNNFLTSMAALTFVDTAKNEITAHHISHVKVQVMNPSTTEIYRYPISSLSQARKGLENIAAFLSHFLNGQSEQNLPYVDTLKINSSELKALNTVNNQIQTALQIEGVNFDGFNSQLEQPNEMEFKGKFISKNEIISFTIHYNTFSNKIFYFGLNE